MDEFQTLLFVTCTWAVAVVTYYIAGRKHGYYTGYVDGLVRGHKDVIEFIRGTNKPNTVEGE